MANAVRVKITSPAKSGAEDTVTWFVDAVSLEPFITFPWRANFDSDSLIVPPSSTNSTTFRITSPIVAASGIYDFNITASNIANPSLKDTKTASYIVL